MLVQQAITPNNNPTKNYKGKRANPSWLDSFSSRCHNIKTFLLFISQQHWWINCNSKRFTKINMINFQHSTINWQHGMIKVGCSMIWSCGLIFIQQTAIVSNVIENNFKYIMISFTMLFYNMVSSILINLHIMHNFIFACSGWCCYQMSLFCNTSKSVVHCCDHFKMNWLCSLYEEARCEFCVVFCVLFVVLDECDFYTSPLH